jgi:hypothetical protein
VRSTNPSESMPDPPEEARGELRADQRMLLEIGVMADFVTFLSHPISKIIPESDLLCCQDH